MTILLTTLQMDAVPRNKTSDIQLLHEYTRFDTPESVASTDSETKAAGEVKPEAFPELAGDGCDGHGK
jgi:hypothetical protein